MRLLNYKVWTQVCLHHEKKISHSITKIIRWESRSITFSICVADSHRSSPRKIQGGRQRCAASTGRGKRDTGWQRGKQPQWVRACGQEVATGQRGEGCRLVVWEQRQGVHDRGQEWAISGRGKRDAGSRACGSRSQGQESAISGDGVLREGVAPASA